MKRRFISIRSKVLLLLGYFLFCLIAVISLDAWFDNAHDRMDHRYKELLQQGEHASGIQRMVEVMHSDLYRLVYRDDDIELHSRLLSSNEDLLIGFEEFSRASQELGFDEDYFFLLENETVLLKLRADIFRAVSLQRAGERQQAVQILGKQIEPGIIHMASFIESANEIRRLKIADYFEAYDALHIQERGLELVVSWLVLFVGLFVALFMSRSIIRPIESLTAQIRGLKQAGDLRSRLVSAANDESGFLTDAFNDLLDVREDAEAALARHNEILEQKVKQRTGELMMAQEKLIKKDRLVVLGQVTGMVSHELRNPLGAISASMYTLRKRLTGKKPETGHILERIERNVGRCDRIVDELLVFSRTRKLSLTEVDFDDWLDRLLSDYSLPDQISLQRDLDSNVSVFIDTEIMRGVIINLLSNAAEAISSKGDAAQADGEIRVSTARSAGQLICTIEDNGPGMSEAVLKQVFEPLFTTKTFGVGLGMAVVERSVEQHGGQLALDSGQGRGTRCTIRLNLQQGK